MRPTELIFIIGLLNVSVVQGGMAFCVMTTQQLLQHEQSACSHLLLQDLGMPTGAAMACSICRTKSGQIQRQVAHTAVLCSTFWFWCQHMKLCHLKHTALACSTWNVWVVKWTTTIRFHRQFEGNHVYLSTSARFSCFQCMCVEQPLASASWLSSKAYLMPESVGVALNASRSISLLPAHGA